SDARGAGREMIVVDRTDDGCWAEIERTAYITPGIALTRLNSGTKRKDVAEVSNFSAPPGVIEVGIGDVLILTRHLRPGRRATRDRAGRVLSPASIGCTLPEIFDDVQTGERVWLDDGKIAGFIEKVEKERIFIRITQARVQGETLRAD